MLNLITIGDTVLDTYIILDETDTNNVRLSSDKQFLQFRFADKICIQDSMQSVGGNAANVAAGVQKLGHRTALVSEMGRDYHGDILYSELKSTRIDLSLVSQKKSLHSRYAIVLNYDSERTILSYNSPHKYKLPKLPDTQWIFYSSLSSGFEPLQKKLEKYLKKNSNIQLAVNPGSHQMKYGKDHILRLLPRTNILFVNKDEARELTEKPKADITTLMTTLHQLGAKEVAITDGSVGSYTSDEEHILFMPIYPITPIAKTGAGDAYTSGYLAARMSAKDISTAMQWGTANAGGVIREFGAQHGLQTAQDIKKTIKKYLSVIPVKL